MRALTITVLLLAAACSDDSQSPCPLCGSGMVCNATTKQCEPEQKECTPACQAPQVCDTKTGQCVSSTTCTPACGAGADCQAGSCVCQSGIYDCDGDLGKAGGNGCECNKPCAQCKPATCDAATKGSCVSPSLYCAAGSCVSCAVGTLNCDGDNANACEVTASSCSASSGLADDACPPTTPPVTQTTTIKSITTKQTIPDHCSMTSPFTQVVAVKVDAQKKITFSAAATGAEIVLSLRSQCAVDHGCGLGLDKVTYERTVDAGTYNLVVATNKSASYELTITIANP